MAGVAYIDDKSEIITPLTGPQHQLQGDAIASKKTFDFPPRSILPQKRTSTNTALTNLFLI